MLAVHALVPALALYNSGVTVHAYNTRISEVKAEGLEILLHIPLHKELEASLAT